MGSSRDPAVGGAGQGRPGGAPGGHAHLRGRGNVAAEQPDQRPAVRRGPSRLHIRGRVPPALDLSGGGRRARQTGGHLCRTSATSRARTASTRSCAWTGSRRWASGWARRRGGASGCCSPPVTPPVCSPSTWRLRRRCARPGRPCSPRLPAGRTDRGTRCATSATSAGWRCSPTAPACCTATTRSRCGACSPCWTSPASRPRIWSSPTTGTRAPPGQAGIDTVGFADCNDPALFLAEAEGTVRVAVPLDDNVQPHLYGPVSDYLLSCM